MADGMSAQLSATDASAAASFAGTDRDASTRLAAEYLSAKDPAQASDANNSAALGRAAIVLVGGLKDGIVDSAVNSLNLQTAVSAVESVAMGYGLGALVKAGPVGQRLAMAGGLVMGANWAYDELIGGRPQATIAAVADAYASPDRLAADRQTVASTGGALAFDTALAFAAGGLGMKKGLDLKSDWHMDAAAAIKAKYSGAVDFLSSDGRAHGAHLLGDGQFGMAFAGKDTLAPEAKPALPTFSDRTLAILANKPDAAGLAKGPYKVVEKGVPVEFYLGGKGPVAVVPFSKVAEILDPHAAGKSVGSFGEMGDIIKAQARLKLGQSDPVAGGLLNEIRTGASEASVLSGIGADLAKAQDLLLKPHGQYGEQVKSHVSQILFKERDVKAIEDQAKNIQILRLEAGRIMNKLNIMNSEDMSAVTESSSRIKTDLYDKHAFLVDEVGERSSQVGSVKDPWSPISMARAELKSARDNLEYGIVWGKGSSFQSDGLDLGPLDPVSLAKHIDDLVKTQSAIDKNTEALQALAMKFSDAVYAYNARMDGLQKVGVPQPVPVERTFAKSIERANAKLVGTEARQTGEKAVEKPPVQAVTFDAKVQAAAALDGPLQANLKGRATALLSTDVLQRTGALDRATIMLFERSTIALFKDGKPVTFIGKDLKPHMAVLDVRNFDDRLAQMPEVSANGYAIFSPQLLADGSLDVLRQTTPTGQPPRTVFKKSVTMTGGMVPKNINEGTSLGKLFALFSSGER